MSNKLMKAALDCGNDNYIFQNILFPKNKNSELIKVLQSRIPE
ncbi:MAG: hypothetical protein ACJ0G8_05510 [Dehalococcoidia bacterium]